MTYESSSDPVTIPTIPSKFKPYYIYCGYQNTFIFTRKTDVIGNQTFIFSSGRNAYGILGYNGDLDSVFFEQLPNPFPYIVDRMRIRRGHGVLITKEGYIFTIGANGYGQLGNAGTAENLEDSPIYLDQFPMQNEMYQKKKAFRIAFGVSSVAFFYDNSVLDYYIPNFPSTTRVFGQNLKGELAIEDALYKTQKEKADLKYQKIVMNEDYYSFGINGKTIKAFGNNENGALGIGYDLQYYGYDNEKNVKRQETEVIIPENLKSYEIVNIFTEFFQTFIVFRHPITKQQKIASFGKCTNGNIGRLFNSIKECWIPQECCNNVFTDQAVSVSKIAVGQDHAVILMNSGEVCRFFSNSFKISCLTKITLCFAFFAFFY